MTTVRALTLSAIAIAFVGCGDKDAEETAAPCDISIQETFPAAGATNAYYREAIEAPADLRRVAVGHRADLRLEARRREVVVVISRAVHRQAAAVACKHARRVGHDQPHA